jgi:hypothetical protein
MTKKITVNENYQTGYSYELNQPLGENFSPNFKSELTPKEMLKLGVFGGSYFKAVPNEFPGDWLMK